MPRTRRTVPLVLIDDTNPTHIAQARATTTHPLRHHEQRLGRVHTALLGLLYVGWGAGGKVGNMHWDCVDEWYECTRGAQGGMCWDHAMCGRRYVATFVHARSPAAPPVRPTLPVVAYPPVVHATHATSVHAAPLSHQDTNSSSGHFGLSNVTNLGAHTPTQHAPTNNMHAPTTCTHQPTHTHPHDTHPPADMPMDCSLSMDSKSSSTATALP